MFNLGYLQFIWEIVTDIKRSSFYSLFYNETADVSNQEQFVDLNNNGIWDESEEYIDSNGNLLYDENYIGYQDISECEGCIPGDVNGDLILNILDIITIVNCILYEDCNDCSDINGDGTINILDAIYAVNSILSQT